MSAPETVSIDGSPLATLTPISRAFEPATSTVADETRYVLSRFAYVRADAGALLLESPRAHAHVVLHDWRAAAIVERLACPRRLADVAPPGTVPLDAVRALMTLLLKAEMVVETSSDGVSSEDASPVLRTWEFHDLLFHARSRSGRHDRPVGGTFRFLGALDPAAVLKQIASDRAMDLARPDLSRIEAEDPPFAAVQEARRSIREYGESPITADQLGEFLYRVGRVADFWNVEIVRPAGIVPLPSAPRPYPAAGGLYELDLYVGVNRCAGVDRGFYYYDPERHRLIPLDTARQDLDQLVADAEAAASVAGDTAQIVVVIAARFQRLTWKYASIAYSLILKDVGVLFQTMYLAATAMGLAPCAVGSGDSDLFSRAAGTDYYEESSVGEFLLGSRGDA